MEESIKVAEYITDALGTTRADIRTVSPLNLAYIGDAVYDLWIRTYLVSDGKMDTNHLHKEATQYVSATAQSAIVKAITGELSEEETQILKRGRNAKPHSTAKNASIGDYLNATGFECLIGYLYLTDQDARISELIKKGIEEIDQERRK